MSLISPRFFHLEEGKKKKLIGRQMSAVKKEIYKTNLLKKTELTREMEQEEPEGG